MSTEPRIVRLDPRLAVLDAFREKSPYEPDGGFSVSSLSRSRSITLQGPNALRETEQSVFFALVYLVGRSCEVTSRAASDVQLAQLWEDLRVQCGLGGADWREAGVALCSWRELAWHAGFSGSGAPVQRSIKIALERLANTTVIRETMGSHDATCLISYTTSPKGLAIALEPVSSLVARGLRTYDGRVRQYVSISLDERYCFRDPAARVMHAWLRAWSSSGGRARVITLDRLATKIWSDSPSRSTLSRRRRRLQRLIRDLSRRLPDWSLSLEGDRCTISKSGAGLPLSMWS